MTNARPPYLIKGRFNLYKLVSEKINKIETRVATPVIDSARNKGGKIFGSVGSLQVAEAIKAAGFDVDRKGIKITNEPIKAIGKYEATVKFGKNLTETITFEVVEE